MTTWVNKWNSWVSDKPIAKGVWLRRDGGYYVKGSTTDPKTGREKEVRKNLPDARTPEEARAILDGILETIRSGSAIAQKSNPRFCEYAARYVEERSSIITVDGGWKSASTKIVFCQVLEAYLFPKFGDYFIKQIKPDDIKRWQFELAANIKANRMSPNTANNILKKMRQIVNTYCREYKLENPMAGVSLFDTSLRQTYTREQPNSLRPDEVRLFLETVKKEYPQHFAMTALGFATGLRPSSLRPLRYKGPSADLDLDEGTLQIRQSHSVFQEVMQCTKTGTRYTIALPDEMVDILRWHISMLPNWRKGNSDLLFPGEKGMLSTTRLCVIFAKVAKIAGLNKRVTPRAMRRTFQDLARHAKVDNFVTRSISGHATESMQEWYSTIYDSEKREGLARIVSLAGFREAHAKVHPQVHESGCIDIDNKTASV